MERFSFYHLFLGLGLSLLMTLPVHAGFLDDIKKLEDLKKAGSLQRILEQNTKKPKAERQKKVDAHELEHQKAQAKEDAKRKKMQAEPATKQRQRAQAQTTRTFFYPWESITINMKPGAVERKLEDTGFRKLSPGVTINYSSRNWSRKFRKQAGAFAYHEVSMGGSRGIITSLDFSVPYNSPLQVKKAEDRLFRTVPKKNIGKNCGRKLTYCKGFTDPGTSATVSFFIGSTVRYHARKHIKGTAQSLHKLDYPWEAITLNMTHDAILQLLKSYNFKEKACYKRAKGNCLYAGTIPGKWSGKVVWRFNNGIVNAISFSIYPKDPSQTKETFYNRLLKIVPNGRSNPNCRNLGVSYSCKNIKDPTAPAKVKFSVVDDGVLRVSYIVKKI